MSQNPWNKNPSIPPKPDKNIPEEQKNYVFLGGSCRILELVVKSHVVVADRLLRIILALSLSTFPHPHASTSTSRPLPQMQSSKACFLLPLCWKMCAQKDCVKRFGYDKPCNMWPELSVWHSRKWLAVKHPCAKMQNRRKNIYFDLYPHPERERHVF